MVCRLISMNFVVTFLHNCDDTTEGSRIVVMITAASANATAYKM